MDHERQNGRLQRIELKRVRVEFETSVEDVRKQAVQAVTEDGYPMNVFESSGIGAMGSSHNAPSEHVSEQEKKEQREIGASMNRDEEAVWNEVFKTLDNQLANDHSVASHPPTEDRPFIIAPFSDQRRPAGDPTVGAHRQDTTQLEAHQLPTPLLSQSSPTRISRPRTLQTR